jgi:hypothetical protein
MRVTSTRPLIFAAILVTGVPIAHAVTPICVTSDSNNNTACGSSAFQASVTSVDNSALGAAALGSDTSGSYNTASGMEALASNTTGASNTASGFQALALNTTGNANTGLGGIALYSNSSGTNNTAVGYQSLYEVQHQQRRIEVQAKRIRDLERRQGQYATTQALQELKQQLQAALLERHRDDLVAKR